jgi:hypothetical protein
MRRAAAFLAIAAAATVVGALLPATPGNASAALSVTAVECAKHPGLFDVVYITNSGDAPQDLAGWQLKSDPEGSEQMALATAGALDPGEQLIVVAGAHGVTIPAENVYLWTFLEVLRDGGEPADYVKIFDPAGSFVNGMNCLGQPLSAAAPPPAAPAAQPAAAQSSASAQTANQSSATRSSATQTSKVSAVPNTGGSLPEEPTAMPFVVGVAAVVAGTALVAASIQWQGIADRLTPPEGDSRSRRLRGSRGRD